MAKQKSLLAATPASRKSQSAGPKGISLRPPGDRPGVADDPANSFVERKTGISASENQMVSSLTGGKVDLHALDAQVRHVAPTDSRLREMGATSYTQGNLALIGNPKDRGHEIWHLAQQAQHRVRANVQIGGQPVNTDHRLEREADEKGSLIRQVAQPVPSALAPKTTHKSTQPIQGNGISLLEDPYKKPPDIGALTNLPELLNYAWNGQAEEKELNQLKATFRKLSAGWKSGLGDVLTALLKKYGEKANLTATNVTFGEVTKAKYKGMARATGMVANPLTARPGDTTGSDATTSRWAPNVEGHLLNHLLHGPAEPRNLAPFSGSMNRAHSKNVEEPLKRMVLNENRYFKYTVIPFPQTADKLDDFVPNHVDFEVLELKPDDLTVKPDGYQYSGQIDQAGNMLNETKKNTHTAPTTSVNLKGSDTDADIQALANHWNALQFPWSPAYGELMAFIMEATYVGTTEDQAVNNVDEAKRLYLPKTEIDYGPTRTLKTTLGDKFQVGTKMTAFPLTLRPPDGPNDILGFGYEPETPLGWSPYVAGHLLNHHLHGPASSENLAPMTQTLNSTFESEVEDHLKTKVLSQGKVMMLTVEMLNGEDSIGVFEPGNYFPGVLRAKIRQYIPKPDVVGRKLEKKKNWVGLNEKTVTLKNKPKGGD